MTKVFLDANGNCINIGDWEYGEYTNEIGETVFSNPLPDDAVETEAEVVTGWDGGLYLSTDPRKDN